MAFKIIAKHHLEDLSETQKVILLMKEGIFEKHISEGVNSFDVKTQKYRKRNHVDIIHIKTDSSLSVAELETLISGAVYLALALPLPRLTEISKVHSVKNLDIIMGKINQYRRRVLLLFMASPILTQSNQWVEGTGQKRLEMITEGFATHFGMNTKEIKAKLILESQPLSKQELQQHFGLT